MKHIPWLVCAFLPGVGLDKLETRCQDPNDELQRLLSRLCERLRRLRGDLDDRCSAETLRSLVVDVAVWKQLVTRFRRVVDRHKSKHRLVRFATKRPTLDELEVLHEQVDEQLLRPGLSGDWRRDWAQDRAQMHRLFAERLKEARAAMRGLTTAQVVEVLAILKYEMDFHADEMDPEQVELLRATFTKITTLSGAKVPRIPKFFIPPSAVVVRTPHEIEGVTTGCVLLYGIWDRETRLVAQYVSMDPSYAKTLFLRTTEKWYGLEHENVVKMLGASHLASNRFVVWEDVASCANFINYFAGCGEHERHQRRLWRMFLQVARGLEYIHRQGRTHGSLKCSQILVADGDVPKICLFELSAEDGVDRWKSPEHNLGAGSDPSPAGDIYALGLCIVEARTSETPYGLDSDDVVLRHLREDESYPRPDGFLDEEWAVVEKLCAHNPQDRPSMAQTIQLMEELARTEKMEEARGGVEMANWQTLQTRKHA